MTTQWQAETAGWSTEERGSRSKKGVEAICKTSTAKEPWQRLLRAPKDEDAAAAAEFFVDKGGRKPVDFSRKRRLLHLRRKLGRKVEELQWKISESGVSLVKMRPKEC